MALVVFLRGVNVGGHRTFRPSETARNMAHLQVVNVGAAGTFVVRKAVSQAQVRAELARRLPFETGITICRGRDVLELAAREPFADRPVRRDLVRFVSILSRKPRSTPTTPFRLPARGRWLLEVLAVEKRFVLGIYRREMKAIGSLGEIDRLFGVPATTRNWNTIQAIAEVLRSGEY